MIRARSLAATGFVAFLGFLALAGAGSDANAQQIYRIVGPDGRVTFSDKPPADGSGSKGKSLSLSAATEVASFPFELRQAATRYPVTLYTSGECAPCNAGRAMLVNRGIPFSERTVGGADDIEALKRISGGTTTLPIVTIGGQQLKGYSDSEWGQYLDAAGYPHTSQLPTTYARGLPQPIVAASDPALARPAAPAAAARAPATPGAPPVAENPNGIRF
ncbi:MAG: glutaredoxin family protein [Pseudomonadota bacterium]